ncbi:tail protein X [Kiloniella sp. b19]|uniref:tail protein X n=1 Tax=Kiloniella sp. GXU_MW_B19 TaxID=3141326 RepID=UPI0031E1583B
MIAYQNETLDALCFRHYGHSRMNEAVLEANRGLADLGLFLPEGHSVLMPIEEDTEQSETPTISLWD